MKEFPTKGNLVTPAPAWQAMHEILHPYLVLNMRKIALEAQNSFITLINELQTILQVLPYNGVEIFN